MPKAKPLKKISSKKVTVFKVKNRRSWAAICMNNLCEGTTPQQAVRRLYHPLRRMGYYLGLTALFLLSVLPAAQAASKYEIDAGVKSTLEEFYHEVSAGKKLVKDAKGVLVFPAVYKGGIGIGGEYGEGALLIKGKTADYYNTAAASIGLQLGVQKKSIVIIFTQKEALEKFRASEGWKAGVDASIAVIQAGAGGAMDTSKFKQPILGFIFDQAGLMYNLTLEGAKFTKIAK